MDLGFKGKVELVTGAGSQVGFGKADDTAISGSCEHKSSVKGSR